MFIQWIDTMDLIRALVNEITHMDRKSLIFVDLEGINLSRHVSVAIMQVLVPPNPAVYLIDIHVLQKEAFTAATDDGETLGGILESDTYAKVFFDMRNDSDALYSHFDIRLQGVIDLQLIEFAARPKRGRFLKGLSKCITESRVLSIAQAKEWEKSKDSGVCLFAPERGGTYEVFLRRPLSVVLQRYCAGDVLKLPRLLQVYAARLPAHLVGQVSAEALCRVALSQSIDFNGKGKHMALGPNFTWQR